METSSHAEANARPIRLRFTELPEGVLDIVMRKLDSSDRALLRFVSQRLAGIVARHRVRNGQGVHWSEEDDEYIMLPALGVSSVCQNPELLAWAVSNGCPLTCRTFEAAVATGNTAVVTWLCEQRCPMDARAFSCAAASPSGSSLQLCQLLREHGCTWGPYSCAEAAGEGDLELLRWLVEAGCPVDSSACKWAADGGHAEVRGKREATLDLLIPPLVSSRAQAHTPLPCLLLGS